MFLKMFPVFNESMYGMEQVKSLIAYIEFYMKFWVVQWP